MVTKVAPNGPAAASSAAAAETEHGFPASPAALPTPQPRDTTAGHNHVERQLSSSQGSKSSIAASDSSALAHPVSNGPPALQWAKGYHAEAAISPITASTSPESIHDAARKGHGAMLKATGPVSRPLTPTMATDSSSGVHSTSTSPMNVDSPYMNPGSKRTASGHVKNGSVDVGNYQPIVEGEKKHSPRNSGRVAGISELSSQLKTRLSYAMLKVQYGWEKQSLEQLESLTPTHSIPTTPTLHHGHNRHSSHFTDASASYTNSPAFQISPNRRARGLYETAAVPHGNWGPVDARQEYNSAANKRPTLAPAAPISSSRSKRRSLSTRSPPHLSTTHARPGSGYGSQFATASPSSARGGILRMPSQQAEKDVVDALIFMSSPNNSARLKYEEVPGRRVGFQDSPRYRF